MYACPGCGGNLRFDIIKQTMVCPYCNGEHDPYAVNKEYDAEESQVYNATVFTCPQCAAEIISEDNEAAAFCSYCGGSTILDSRISSFQRPNYIIPFQKTKEDCLKGYRKMMRSAFFAPKELKDPKVIESFRGIYMPYWSYAMDLDREVVIAGKRTYQRGDYKYTEHHRLTSNVKAHYDHVSHDASSTFADNLSMAIAPFDQNRQKPFAPTFLSGFYADACDLPDYLYSEEAAELVGRNCYQQFKKEPLMHRYSIDNESAQKQFIPECSGKNLIMLPVWFMSSRVRTKGQERVTYAVVNGQTGVTTGDIPISVPKYLGVSFGLAAILFILLQFIIDLTISPTVTMVAACVLAVIMYVAYSSTMKKIIGQETGDDDKGLTERRKREEKQMTQEEFSEARFKHLQKKERVKKSPTFVWLPFAVTAALLFGNPIEDSLYYGGAILSLIVVFRMIMLIINRFNLLATRPLPQFRRTGGDDNAVR